MANSGSFKSGDNRPRKKKGDIGIMKTVRDTFAEVFNKLQDDPATNLESFAKKFPKEFHQIASKLIPTEITAQVTQTNVNVIRDEKPDGEAVQTTPGTESNSKGS